MDTERLTAWVLIVKNGKFFAQELGEKILENLCGYQTLKTKNKCVLTNAAFSYFVHFLRNSLINVKAT